MASNQVPQVSTQKAIEDELNVSTMSNNQIMDQISATHVHDDKNFDVESLFIVVKSILNGATHVDNTQDTTQAQPKEKALEACFSPPLCTLKQLSFEMACRDMDEEVAHKITISILSRLSTYSWNAKAVLTLAAFALDYGEFWLLDQLHQSDLLAQSMGILKGVPTVLESSWLLKHKNAIDELCNLIKATLDVVEYIFKLEKLLKNNDLKDISSLSTAKDSIPIHVYWAIITVVVCTTQLCCLINDEDKSPKLFPFAEEINVTLNFLKSHIEPIEDQIRYQKLMEVMENPMEIMVAFKEMTFKPLINDGSTNTQIGIEVVKIKNVLLWFSGLNISEVDISILKSIYEEISKDDQYKIVWIPIEEKWTDDMQKKFDMLRSKMPTWYIEHNYSFKLGIKYVKEKWQFKNKPLVVVMNSQGIVVHPDALRMITVSRMNAFPFTTKKEEELSIGDDWFGYLIFDNFTTMTQSMKEEKHIFFYGGVNKKWKKRFNDKAYVLRKDPIIVDAKISVESFCWAKESDSQTFWNYLQRFHSTMIDKRTESDPLTQAVQKVLSYKTESGWALLCKGFKLVNHGNGTRILQVLEEFDNWKQLVPQIGLVNSFKDYKMILPQKEELFNGEDCIGLQMINHIPKLLTWIQEGKYIFIYGGVDEEWRKQFAKRVEALAKDYVIQDAKISIVLSCVEMGCKGKDDRLQKFLSSRTHKNTESGWVVLSKGSKLVDGGNGITILKVLEEFNKWRWRVRESTMFEICFKDYHKEVLHNGEDWFGYFMIEHFREPKFSTWIQEGKHIFIYGGEDEEWINHFTKKAEALTKDPVIQKAMISIELHHLTMKSKGKYDNGIAGHFWYKLELFSYYKPCTVRQEIEKLISYKNENFGWAVLCKGYKLMVSGNETNILKVLELEEFKKYI
ncbi:hypothetical protein CMV_024782 [Castanea mollissima]|uniref:Sieve element occlusion n=1 Tax=Castanea mollissima TaxID=60419 RepID=A0A8J4QEW0_9ROSI|nr:hypothetical protein CMV_024782 [Castanea mollissima]